MASSFSISGNSFACGRGLRSRPFAYQFAEGSIVYSIEKARVGILEAIYIKKINFVSGLKTYNTIIPMYIDMLNGIWNEGDLCILAEAQVLINEYVETQQTLITQALAMCTT